MTLLKLLEEINTLLKENGGAALDAEVQINVPEEVKDFGYLDISHMDFDDGFVIIKPFTN